MVGISLPLVLSRLSKSCAIKHGRKLNVKVYQCVKDALVRRFGESWYQELELCASEMEKAGML